MRVLSATLLTLSLSIGALAEELPLAPAVEAIRTAFAAHEKLTASVELTASLPVGTNRIPMVGQGDIAYQKDGAKYLQTLVLQMPQPMQMEARVKVLSVGPTVWVTTNIMGNTQVKEDKPDLGKGAIPPGGGLLFDLLDENLTLKRVADETIDGKPAYAFEGTPKGGVELPYVKAEFEVDQETGILREARLYESAGAETVKIRQFDFDLDPDLSEVDFSTPEAAGSGGGAGGATSDPAAGAGAPGAN